MAAYLREKLGLLLKFGLAMLLGVGVWNGGAKQAAAEDGYLTNLEVSAGKNFSIAYSDYYYLAFGHNAFQQLGINDTNTPESPVYVTRDGIKSIVSGANHTLFVTNYGTVEGFGWNEYYQANPDSFHSTVGEPTEIPGLIGITDAAAGNTFSMVLKSDGTVWGWGHNPNIDDLRIATERPVQVKGALEGVKVKAIAAGYNTAYAIAENGDLYEWGESLTGPMPHSEDPHILESHVEKVSVAGRHGLLIKNGRVYSWGTNGFGEQGTGEFMPTLNRTPVPVSSLAGVPVKDVAAGLHHSMALGEDGSVYAWGANEYGQLGKPKSGANPQPYRLNLKNVVSIAAGDYHSLAITKDRSIYAWGRNNYSQIGRPSTSFTDIQDEPYLLHNAAPNAPTGLASETETDGNVGLRWMRNEESDLHHYILYWKKPTDSSFRSTTVYSTYYELKMKDVPEGTYVFKLKAVDKHGKASVFSESLSFQYRRS